MEVPPGFENASEEMKREYLTGNKPSKELVGMIRALLDTEREGPTQTPQLQKHEKAEIYLKLFEQYEDD